MNHRHMPDDLKASLLGAGLKLFLALLEGLLKREKKKKKFVLFYVLKSATIPERLVFMEVDSCIALDWIHSSKQSASCCGNYSLNLCMKWIAGHVRESRKRWRSIGSLRKAVGGNTGVKLLQWLIILSHYKWNYNLDNERIVAGHPSLDKPMTCYIIIVL